MTRPNLIHVLVALAAAVATGGCLRPGFNATGEVEPGKPATYYVCADGADTNPGTREQPFQTVLRARDELRATRKPGEGGTIWIGKGEYQIQETIELTKEDSGSEKAPLVIRAVPNERVSLFGGVRLPRSAFAPVEDQAILARIIDEQAREKLVAVDLRRQGITDFGEHSLRGFTRGLPNRVGKIMPVELSVGGERMRVARWPNPGDSYAQWLPPFQKERLGVVGRPLNAVLDAGPNAGVVNTENPPSPDYFDRGGTFRYEFDRPTLWKEADDVWLDGVLSWSWAWTYNKVARFDTEEKTITMRYADPYGIMDTYSHNFFFFENLLEEIDQPGEYWIDRKNGMLYYYPVAAFFQPEVEIIISQLKKPFFTVTDARHVTFRDFTMESSRGSAVIVTNGTAVRLEQMELRNIGGNGLLLQGGNLAVVRCHISQIGEHAITLDSGNAGKLEPGNSVVEDCHIHHWGYHQRVYRNAISLSNNSCGNRIVRNVLHDSPHSAILLAGNDNVIEYNRMHDVVLEFTDMGAVSGNTGANPLSRGNIIRQNYFHDIGRVPFAHGMVPVYPDWGTMGWTVEQNVFARIGLGDGKMLPSECILVNSGPHIIMRNNVFVNCAIPLRYSSYTGRTGMTVLTNAWKRNFPEAEMERFSLHLSRYPELQDFYREPRDFPTTSLWAQNLVVNSPAYPLKNRSVMREGAIDECKTLQITNNAVVSSDPGFVDMASGNFQLRSNSVAFQLIPGFAAPDFAAMTTHVRTGPFQSVEYVWRPRSYESAPVAGQRRRGAFANEHPMAPITAGKVLSPPTIDGVLSPGEWPGAALSLKESPTRGEIKGAPASAYIAHDGKNIYVAVRIPIADASKMKTGATWGQDDGMEVCIREIRDDADGIRLPTYVLQGFTGGKHQATGNPDEDFEKETKALGAAVRFAATIDADCWIGEWAIPLEAMNIRYSPGKRLQFNIGVRRCDTDEWIALAGAMGPNFLVGNAAVIILE